MEKIYKVTTQGDCEGKTTNIIAYASGRRDVIMEYYDDQKVYDISLEEITVTNITPHSAAEKRNLLCRKRELEEELERILIEGGWFLLLLKVSFTLLFIVLSSIPKGLSSLIFLLIFGYFPLVSNTYNSFFFLWGIISLSWQYEQKNSFLHS